MFYVSWKLRDINKKVTPKGPSFEHSKKYRFLVNQSEVSFNAPSHNSKIATDPPPNKPQKIYKLEHLKTEAISTKIRDWEYLNIFRSSWDFYGPWFTGKLGGVDATITILTPKNKNDDLSFFNPRVFESTIADYLKRYYFDNKRKEINTQSFLCPLNWSPQKIGNLEGVRFDISGVKNIKSKQSDSFERELWAPISHHHALNVSFRISRSAVYINNPSTPEPNIEDWVDFSPILELANNVLNSVEIKLSDEAQAARQEAIKGLDDPSLTKSFPPLNWLDEGNPMDALDGLPNLPR